MTAFSARPQAENAPIHIEDLPEWMRPRQRRPDWRLLVIAALCVPFLWPLLTRQGLPADNDSALYIARSIQAADLMRSGTLYSRWAPDFYNGLGSPLFNFLAPLPHYLSGLHELITDARATDSVRLLTALALIAAAFGMYAFVSGRLGPRPAMVAAAMYVCSAPIGLLLPYVLGDLASLLSMGLLPTVGWLLDRAAIGTESGPWTAAVGALALWVLSDARMALVSSPFLIMILLTGPGRLQTTPPRWRALVRKLSATLVAFLITAFFWLPALAERDSVVWLQTDRAPGQGSASVQAGGWFQPIDPFWLWVGWGPFAGACSAALALHGALQYSRPSAKRRLADRGRRRVELIALTAACAIPFVSALPALAALMATPTGVHGIAPDTRDEAALGVYGAVRGGFLVPVTAYRASDPEALLAFEKVRKINGGDLYPLSMGVSLVERSPLASRYTVSLISTDLTRFDRYAFPGWAISIDGVTYDPQTDSAGLVAFNVPGTAREAVIWFGTTQARAAGWAVSTFGVLLVVLRLRRGHPSEESARRIARLPGVSSPSVPARD